MRVDLSSGSSPPSPWSGVSSPQGALADSEFPRATCVAIAEDGRALTSDDLGRLIAWDISDPNIQNFPHVVFDQKHVVGNATYKAAYVATHGNRALTAGYDGKVLIHDLNNPHKTNPPFTGHHTDDGREVWVAIFSPDGKHALSGANDGQILLWDPSNVSKPPREFLYLDAKKKKANAEGPVAGLAFLPPRGDKHRFLSTHGYGDVHLWEYNPNDASEPAAIVKTFSQGNSRQVNAVVVLGDRYFLTAGFDHILRMWDADDPKPTPKEVFVYATEHKDWVWRVAHSSQLKLAATASEDGSVRKWHAGTGPDDLSTPLRKKSVTAEKVTNNGSMGAAFTEDGRLVVTLDGTAAHDDPQHINGLIAVR